MVKPEIEWFGPTTLTELVLLLIAFVLSAIIGLERNRKLKSAGLRTHTLVGVGSAVFTLVSAYGFVSVLGPEVVVDPSRIAAQIVSGIGFLGAGVIFVKRGNVAGLTTAASIWLTAAVGMACGAGAPALAVMATAVHLLTVTVFGPLGRRLQGAPPHTIFVMRYHPGHGALPVAMSLSAEQGTTATLVSAHTTHHADDGALVSATIQLDETWDGAAHIIDAICDLPGVKTVRVMGPRELGE